VAYLGEQAALYKRWRLPSPAPTRACGFAGSSPEIHEKIDRTPAAGWWFSSPSPRAHAALHPAARPVCVERLLIDEPGVPGGFYGWMKTFLCTALAGEPQPGYEPEDEAAQRYTISEVAWFDLRTPPAWGMDIQADPFTYPLLLRLRALLGYE
jgi:hypothetical protein